MPLTTVAEAKAYMGVSTTAHDAEITRLVAQADGVVQSHAGPALQQQTFVERHPGGRLLILRRYPVVSVTSIGQVSGGVSTLHTGPASDYAIINAEVGSIASPFSSGNVEVTYVAGPVTPPPEAVDAALVFVSYKYRRNHGGSESYMPAGVDGGIAPPMGVGALEQQIRLALGPYAEAGAVA